MADYTGSWINLALLACPMMLDSDRRFSRLPTLPPESQASTLPPLSIIVPARNEAVNLQKLLPTLNAIIYPGPVEIIVVDDGSTDRTMEVANSNGTKIIHIERVAEGWTGKSYACHLGALQATGDWLLFTDADTLHNPNGPARAVDYAAGESLDGLSIFVKQIPNDWLDGVSLAVAYSGLFAAVREDDAFLNGQFILLRKDVYIETGGFAEVRTEPLEDLALGHKLNSFGRKVTFVRSDDVATVHMYSENRALWQGLSRIGAGSLSWLGVRSLIPVMVITGIMSPILAVISAFKMRRKRTPALVSWLLVSISFIPWAQRFGDLKLAPLAPIGALVVQIAAVWGLIRRLLGWGTSWKGRQV